MNLHIPCFRIHCAICQHHTVLFKTVQLHVHAGETASPTGSSVHDRACKPIWKPWAMQLVLAEVGKWPRLQTGIGYKSLTAETIPTLRSEHRYIILFWWWTFNSAHMRHGSGHNLLWYEVESFFHNFVHCNSLEQRNPLSWLRNTWKAPRVLTLHYVQLCSMSHYWGAASEFHSPHLQSNSWSQTRVMVSRNLIPRNVSKNGQLADKEVFLHTDVTCVECCVPDTHTDCKITCN